MTVKPEIAVVGVGYVGLVAAASFAASGTMVTAVDSDVVKINNLKQNILPISEPGLDHLVERAINKGKINFSADLESAIKTSNIIIIAVGTPFDNDTGETDLTALLSVLKVIMSVATDATLIVNKSTAPIGTVDKINDIIKDAGKEGILTAIANPEFLSQGSAVKDFTQPERVVIGVDKKSDAEILINSYASFVARERIIVTSPATAEISKYSANSMLATRVAFINEVAQIADHYNANIKDIGNILGLDPRIGSKFLNAGPGYGGSCFPKDLKSLNKSFLDLKLELPLLESVNRSNDVTISYLANKLKILIEKRGVRKLTIWGLSFKAGTDDVRDSQPIQIISHLLSETKCEICCFDKIAESNAKLLLGNKVTFANSASESLKNSELLCILTEWEEYKNYPLTQIKEEMVQANIVDYRNIISVSDALDVGINLINFANSN